MYPINKTGRTVRVGTYRYHVVGRVLVAKSSPSTNALVHRIGFKLKSIRVGVVEATGGLHRHRRGRQGELMKNRRRITCQEQSNIIRITQVTIRFDLPGKGHGARPVTCLLMCTNCYRGNTYNMFLSDAITNIQTCASSTLYQDASRSCKPKQGCEQRTWKACGE